MERDFKIKPPLLHKIVRFEAFQLQTRLAWANAACHNEACFPSG